MKHIGKFVLRPFQTEHQTEARRIILSGLEERFGFLDETLNPDVDDIYNQYISNGDDFIVGLIDEEMVCTGALIKEAANTGRIVRVSVKRAYRRHGLAVAVMNNLEELARGKGYRRRVLETNETWQSAILFYKKIGYQVEKYEDGCVHMFKDID
ncbi:MAG: GNAT family N-acetyltransferase [Tuberibacillus sp.]